VGIELRPQNLGEEEEELSSETVGEEEGLRPGDLTGQGGEEEVEEEEEEEEEEERRTSQNLLGKG
jgi:hypothetical protein